MPIEPHQCANFEYKVRLTMAALEEEHDACLEADNNKNSLGTFAKDVNSKCTKPACQFVHDRRREVEKDGAAKASACHATVAAYRMERYEKEEKASARKEEKDLRMVCGRQRAAYRDSCVGGAATDTGQKKCNEDLRLLRRECPL